MVGFLTGVAVNIVLAQLADLTGSDRARGSIPLTRGIDVILHPGHWNLPSLACGLVALAIMAGLGRTRLSAFSALLALAVPTVIAAARRHHRARGRRRRGHPDRGSRFPACPASTCSST